MTEDILESRMMSPNQNFDETVSRWIELVKDGDKVSFERLWERYFTSLVGLAKKNMARHAVRVADEEDVVQSALASFYFRAQEGRYPELNDRDGFWKLLMSITLNKARAHARKEGRRSEILEREFSGDNFLRGEPAPELALEMSDQLERLLQKLEDDLLRQIAVAKLEGCSNQEIADRVGKSIPTVERKLRLIRTLWGAELLEHA